jgi:diguanylate cyclase (GGDEF)-like protein
MAGGTRTWSAASATTRRVAGRCSATRTTICRTTASCGNGSCTPRTSRASNASSPKPSAATPSTTTPRCGCATRTATTSRCCRAATSEENTHRLAYFDALTGLPNRRLLVDRIEQALGAAQRSGQVGALLFIDLDNFKQINDARGHPVGDRLLEQAAQRLSQQLRGDDSVARLGGDEFVVLVGQLGHDVEAGARCARTVADKVREVLEQPYDIDGTLYNSSGSIGITLFPKADERVDDLLREADTAMYRAKSAGRNRIAFFEPEMQTEVEDRLALEQDLKGAVGSGQISVHMQPQFDAGGAEVGGELPLHWCSRSPRTCSSTTGKAHGRACPSWCNWASAFPSTTSALATPVWPTCASCPCSS